MLPPSALILTMCYQLWVRFTFVNYKTKFIMSAYGPALFIWRKDGAHLTEEEKATLGTLVIRHTQKLKLEDDEGKPCNPGVYGYAWKLTIRRERIRLLAKFNFEKQ